MNLSLSLSVLKNYLIEVENDVNEDDCVENIEWIKNNIGDEDVSVREWLDKVSDYWYKIGEEGGDSEFIGDMLENVYKLSKEDVDIVMKEYWG